MKRIVNTQCALATAAFVLGPDTGLDFLRRTGAQAAIIVDQAGGVHHLDDEPAAADPGRVNGSGP